MSFFGNRVIYFVTEYEDVRHQNEIRSVETAHKDTLIDWKRRSLNARMKVYLLDSTEKPVLVFDGKEYTDVKYDPDYQTYMQLKSRFENQP